MENNKILIGAQFTFTDSFGKPKSYHIELYVLRDLTLHQLLEGIKYGLERMSAEDKVNSAIYQMCSQIFCNCVTQTAADGNEEYFTHLIFSSFSKEAAKPYIRDGSRVSFYVEKAMDTPLCKLGFITSSRLIFDATGAHEASGGLDTSHLIEAFDPAYSQTIFYPEYNISSRQLYRFDDEPVEIIDPPEPPQKPESNLFFLLLPSIITVGILLIARTLMMATSGGMGLTMIILSAAMAVTAVVTTTITWSRQKKTYAKDLSAWRKQYEDYADDLMHSIRVRQEDDTQKLDELYPDMLTLIEKNRAGIYSLNDRLYSRSPNDEDFLTWRIGVSDDVRSKFPINAGKKDVIFSSALFDFVVDNSGRDRTRIFLRTELKPDERKGKMNLCKLPDALSRRFTFLHGAPLLYSLKDRQALGLVDHNIGSDFAVSRYFIQRMIFELCYYHSPDDLQFVMFFDKMTRWDDIEVTITTYKFLPHFRGLFDDKSQFVFDSNSANQVLSSLLTIMGRRCQDSENSAQKSPHIVMIVFNDHGMKEHAFAEHLPKVPVSYENRPDNLGLSFVFASKYKEHLPAYCDDIINFDEKPMTLTPHEDTNAVQRFVYSEAAEKNLREHMLTFIRQMVPAMRFFSAVYYERIAQNGKVPSMVSALDLLGDGHTPLKDLIRSSWERNAGGQRNDVTKSLSVPIGKTETGTTELDLHERGDGPHMLVAGTTGSGKTETIITYLLGLCMRFRPDELNLLLVDMKGGGFTKRIGMLPHVVGAVTDVDGDENGTGAEYMMGRFLDAMKAEIQRRKLLFNKLHVDSIDAYIHACRNIDAYIAKKKLSDSEAAVVREEAKNNPLSHLILVVDEFTELKRFSNENSDLDYMSEITTIARVGRSLGFHIILISQNIEGAITEDIRVNSRARLCLKVATRQASKDMIGNELAASPFMPGNGRAYLLVGTGSKFEYFQSGYSGASSTPEETSVSITLASKNGAYQTFYQSDRDNRNLRKKREEAQGSNQTQLEAITEAILAAYSEESSISKPHTVFQAPLPKRIALGKDGKPVVLAEQGGQS